MTVEDEHLEHHGVKGMRWGVNKAVSAGKKVAADAEKKDREIDAARAAHPELKAKYKDAKKQYKTDKKELGRSEAKKILKKSGDAYYKNLNKALDEKNQESFDRVMKKVTDDIDRKNTERAYQKRVDAGKQAPRR